MNRVQWWCAATDGPWTWEFQAYPGIWLLVGAILGAYLWALRQRRSEAEPPASRSQLFCFLSGLVLLWLVLDWPTGALAAGYLLTAHMLQFLMITFVIAPVLDAGMPDWMYRRLVEARGMGWLRFFVRRPVRAFVFFNAVLVLTHLPAIGDMLKPLWWGSMAIDLAWILSSMVFWWAVRPMGDREALAAGYGRRFLYLAGIKVPPIFLGVFFVNAEFPLFATYELANRVWGLSALDDQILAGVVMWMGTTPFLLYRLGAAWFAWAALETRDPGSARPG